MGAGASYGKRDEKFPIAKITSEPNNYGEVKIIGEYTNIIEGLPVVNELYGRLDYIYNLITNLSPTDKQYFTQDGIPYTSKQAKESLLKDIAWLKEETRRHATIDTFAKKLYLTNKSDEYQKLKLILSIFFVIEQLVGKADSRYDTFLASILDKRLEIPDNIKILTWNYDRQFEFVYREYAENRYINAINSSQLGVFDFRKNEILSNKWSIYKINGTADFDVPLQYALSEEQSLGDKALDCILEQYIRSIYSYGMFANNSRLYFAWENQDWTKELFTKVSQDIQDSNILIVIGYTFPFFNRETDRFLFKNMPNLKKIYIQDPNAEQLKQNIQPVLSSEQNVAGLGNHITTITNCSQFFLPPEL